MANAGTKTSFLSQRPWIISLVLLCALLFWVGTGHSDDGPPPASKETVTPLTKVSVETFFSEPVTRSISLYGRTEPDRDATISAEASGRVIKVSVRKGAAVKKGDLLIFIDKGDREAQIKRAKALLQVRQKEYNAASSLSQKGLQGEVAFSQAQANLAEARATVENLELALSNTAVRAPFDGIVDDMTVEVGDYLGVGDPVATLLDLDPLIVTADVSERHIRNIDASLPAKVLLVDGTAKEGRLRYQSSISSPETHTFTIELEIPNPDQTLPAGISAEVDLALEQKRAVKLSPSMLALDEKGNLGVKTLRESNVAFVPANVVKAEQNGVWLSGLGDEVDIITKGQGFVRDGDAVDVVRQSPAQYTITGASDEKLD
ncbi:efflux RND transporter periplasmic adaptor subunit [Grimontia hollisae]|uniref:Multidrug resistance protein mexA n=1 Tax=Grimontia hollisae TaxID=673 RepID=A0A377HQ88_GRIHO|nr:efflux RND transporter periplasmic adaptor subunit [Grimontia hollisae]AMG31039.1 efflux RND transporter periplasmic adaptor subunit [Grimontia hollisae]MDF2186460.1 efflux RND transporter periplasmic adaptor subunit [Grimontia hollisae]STO46835.1 Multidrug resistance protein mexA precursor [Grimontia hollisae]STO58411.1 Multidrug resistance protein mexA precursor [Grimontia hollisae]